MTKEEINQLGHAFFDGKTLQYLQYGSSKYLDWTIENCPSFVNKTTNWRIKPDEPKTITICTFVSKTGYVTKAVLGSEVFTKYKYADLTHIKSLDEVVEVE